MTNDLLAACAPNSNPSSQRTSALCRAPLARRASGVARLQPREEAPSLSILCLNPESEWSLISDSLTRRVEIYGETWGQELGI